MWEKLYSNSGLILLAVILLVSSASDVHAQGRGRFRLMTFEGTLLKYSPHPKILCGDLFIHQVAKYRVDRVLSGKHVGDEIVVDHPACGGNVFENVPVGSRVRITVRVWREYLHTTNYPGIRDEQTTPKVWYVAGEPPSAFAPPKGLSKNNLTIWSGTICQIVPLCGFPNEKVFWQIVKLFLDKP